MQQKSRLSKSAVISFRVTQEQFTKISKIAKAYGIGPHEWAGNTVTKAIPEEEQRMFGKVQEIKTSEMIPSNAKNTQHAFKKKKP